jgi:hypothetical protein
MRFIESHFTLSLVTTPTEKLSVQDPCGSKKTSLFCRVEKWTTVSMQELNPIDSILIYKRQHCGGKGRYCDICNYGR